MIVNAFTHHIGKVEGANLVAHPKSTPTPASQPPTLYYLEPIPMEKTCPTHKVTDFGAISGTTSSDRTWASLCLGLVQGGFRVACTYYSHLFRGGGRRHKAGQKLCQYSDARGRFCNQNEWDHGGGQVALHNATSRI